MYLLARMTEKQSVYLGFQSLHNILSGTVQELMEKSMYYCIHLCNNLEKSRDGSRIDGAVKRERKGDADNCGADIQMVRTTQILQRPP